MTLDDLGARERQIMEAVYRLNEATVKDVLDELPDSLHYSTVRTMLNKLEEKGYLRHMEDGRKFVYVPTRSKEKTQRDTLTRVVRNLFDGSAARAMVALLDLGELSDVEVAQIKARFDAVRSNEK